MIRKKGESADEKENDVWNQMSSLSECTSDAVASLAVAVDQAQERELLSAQATIEITRMWNALYFSRCYQLEWSTKSQELEEIENKRKARHARKMITQRKVSVFSSMSDSRKSTCTIDKINHKNEVAKNFFLLLRFFN